MHLKLITPLSKRPSLVITEKREIADLCSEPCSPTEDMPQLIAAVLVSADNRVSDVWWSEVMGLVGSGRSEFVTQGQLERIADWLASEPRGFTDKGIETVDRMLAKVCYALSLSKEQGTWRLQCETNEWDHLL